MRWRVPHRSSVKFYSSSDPLQIKNKDGSEISILDICKSVTPESCHLNPLLFNGDLQTLWTGATTEKVPIAFKRRIFTVDEGAFVGSFAADFVASSSDALHKTCTTEPYEEYSDDEFLKAASDDTRSMLIILHGLVGSSQDIYLRHVIRPLVEAGDWDVVALNSRGCGNSKITSPMLFNARATWDIRHLVQQLRVMYPNRKLFGLGFSLGANILVNVSLSASSKFRHLCIVMLLGMQGI